MKVTWLHISDFHIRDGDSYDRDTVLGALVRSVRELRIRQGRQPDLIFATGDIAQAGKAKEYAHATAFFDAILEAVGLERSRLFVVPGNHDVDRDLGIGLARTLGSREEADQYFGPHVPKAHATQQLGAFHEWYNCYFAGIRTLPTDTTCGPVEVVDIRGLRIGILPMNSALFCQADDDEGKLILGRRCLGDALERLKGLEANLNVALLHHPLEWLCDFERANIKASLHDAVDVILHGHLHETEVESVVSASGGSLHLAAGAAYQTRKWPHRAHYCTVADGQVSIFPIRYEDSPIEVWKVDPSVFPREPRHEKAFAIPGRAEAAGGRRPELAAEPDKVQEVPRFRSNIPSRGDLPFVGREQSLAEMEELLEDPWLEPVLVLHGQPGVGKSELAREFARTRSDRYPGGTFFLRTGGGAELLDLAHIGATVLGLQFPADLPLPDQAKRTLLALAAAPALLIYDNVAEPDAVRSWLPRGEMPFHVIMITVNERLYLEWRALPRNECLSLEWRALPVLPLADPIAYDLVEKLAGRPVRERHGDGLVTLAGGLPIQLVLASRTLAYEARRRRLDHPQFGISSEDQECFRLVYEALDDSARLLLHAAAFLNHERIVRSELLRHLEQPQEGSQAGFERCLEVCLDLHLLEGSGELRMHQLFAAFINENPLSRELMAELDRVRERQWTRLVEVAIQVEGNPSDRDRVSALLTYPPDPDTWDSAAVPRALDDELRLAGALVAIGRFNEARPWYERAVVAKEQGGVDGRVDHDSLGRSLYQVGFCLHKLGEAAEAISWLQRAAAAEQQGDVLGRVDHEVLGRTLHLLAQCLSEVGVAEGARRRYERAIAEKEQGDIYGRVDYDSLSGSLHAVGVCLSDQAEFEQALPWYRRAVDAAERGDVHGRVDHESLGASLHQAAICLSWDGKREEALPWFQRAIAEIRMGDVHGRVNTASLDFSLRQLAYTLRKLGREDEARQYEAEADQLPS